MKKIGIRKYAKRYAHFLVLAVLCALIQATAQLFAPVYMGKAIDGIVGVSNVDMSRVVGHIMEMAAAIAVAVCLMYFMHFFTGKAAAHTIKDIRTDMFKKLNRVPLRELDKFSHGNLLSRITADSERVSDGLIQLFTQLFSGGTIIIGTLVFMLRLNLLVGLAVVLITPLSVITAYFVARLSRKLFSKQLAAEGELSGITEEYISNQRMVKILGCERLAEEKYAEANQKIHKYGAKAVFVSAIVNPSTRLINGIVYVVVILISAFLIVSTDSALTIGEVSVFLSYALSYAKPFNEISAVITELQSASAAAVRIKEILELPDETPDYANELSDVDAKNGAVEFRDVCFSYDGKPFITDFNLLAQSGKRIAIVGKTGCGKTTLISLLMRFYDLDAGAITINGKDIRNVSRQSLRKQIGMVLQDTWLFKGTVRQNLAYGKRNATLEEIIAAAKRARIDGFIQRLEHGYDTVLEPSSLSAGQMQLLCIARVFLSMPAILILDEATSNIDARTETKISEAFADMMENTTSFVVAHRMSTIRGADLILVMDNGRVVERGTHEQLLDKGGYYYTLINSSNTVDDPPQSNQLLDINNISN